MPRPAPLAALRLAVEALRGERRKFALVGGLAVSARAEPRFTRDVDIAVAVQSDEDAEGLVFRLGGAGLTVIATVEHEKQRRLATARLETPSGVVVDLLFASSGIEHEIVDRSEDIDVADLGRIPVARAEELLAMKTLSESEDRLQDRIDARNLVDATPGIDLNAVRASLRLIVERGFSRDQDLGAKLDRLLRR